VSDDFRDEGRLDTSQVEDRRGRSIGGRPMIAGGGGIAIVVVLLTLLLGGNPFGGGGGADLGVLADLNNQQIGEGAPQSDISQKCQTGADAETAEDCRAVAYVNSINNFWETAFAQYQPAKTIFFSGSTDTGCGRATSEVGPFYCPADKQVYIDLGFLAELHDRFGAQAGPFTVGYILAHEYGHHVQDLLGVLDKVRTDHTGPQSAAVRSELQADCYAGVWASQAERFGTTLKVSDAEIADAIDAASAVGDDRIQKSTQGQVNPETWTHGSAAQRVKWLKRGYTTKDPSQCDTFSGSI
jgi:predicted metalloprotease